MTNLQIMKKALQQLVISPLLQEGFTGKWPHFQRVASDHIALISFQTNKYGGSFTVEISAVFPDRDETNYAVRDAVAPGERNVWYTNHRYRLKGMYDGWFFYRDVYAKRSLFTGTHYLAVSEKEADSFVPPLGYRLVQHFQPETADVVCECVNRQLDDGFRWLEQFIKRSLG